MSRFALIFLSAFLILPIARADDDSNDIMLQRYFDAVAHQREKVRNVGMDMEFDAKLPRINRNGKMIGMKLISSLGKISFVVKSFTGDKSIKTDVIARYLSAEQETSVKPMDAAINEANYKFKFKRSETVNGHRVAVYELNPRKKRLGLFKGEIWIDADTALPVIETGQFVKNPSFLLKKVRFKREYTVHDGLALPKHIESTVETRIAGKAELVIDYSNFHHSSDDEAASTDSAPRAELTH